MNSESKRTKKIREQRERAQQADKAARDGNNPADNKQPPWAALQGAIAKFYAEYKKDKSDKSENLERQLGVAERQIIVASFGNKIAIGTAIISFAGLFFVYLSLKATKESTIEANRAWLYPENLKVFLTKIPGTRRLTILEYNGTDPTMNGMVGKPVPGSEDEPIEIDSIEITGDTKNTGNSPATEVFFSGKHNYGFADMIPDGPYFDASVPIDETLCNNAKTKLDRDIGKSSVIFKDQELSYRRYWPSDISETDIKALKTGTKAAYWGDCVSYKSFGEYRTSPFCVMLIWDIRENGWRTYRCKNGNGAT